MEEDDMVKSRYGNTLVQRETHRCAFCMGGSVVSPTFFRRSIGDPVRLSLTPSVTPFNFSVTPPSRTPELDWLNFGLAFPQLSSAVKPLCG